ncbi:ABC transporter permease [Palaeococcus ferrophilus]|uniref:ABC transporter permease n=1 Tax=Palaeococcus ferrophilus TaxID=83868 RepID=UPI00064EF795|nr:ABC transporter permease [Palaeococcus ferrophilus]
MEATEFRAFWGVMVKSWRVFTSYKVWLVTDIAMGLFFVAQALLIGLGLTGERNSPALQKLTGYSDYVTFAVLGLMVLFFGMTFLSGFVWSVVDELYAGTLESSFAAPMRRITFFLGNVAMRLLLTLLYLILYLVFFKLLFGISLSPTGFLRGIPILFIGSIGMIGFGMAATGVVIYFRDPGPFISILEMLVFALSGAMYPIDILPRWLALLAKILPYAPTTDALRTAVTHGYGTASAKIAYVAFVSLVYALLGFLVYRWSERQARRVGLKSY